ncbi:MAG TPA: hypothetical protein VGR37_16300 [Longimicrobiaceae bacterium]|nr:hypothetical protein [Longimicrobiaceae bacterium]
MSRIHRFAAAFVFAAAIAGSLAFGATQALATPPVAEVRACNDDYCAYLCGGLGYCRGQACACY